MVPDPDGGSWRRTTAAGVDRRAERHQLTQTTGPCRACGTASLEFVQSSGLLEQFMAEPGRLPKLV